MSGVLLINPTSNRIFSKNYSFFPIGIASLGSVLRAKGFNVKIIDFQAHPEYLENGKYLENEIELFNPDIVGIGCLFSFYYPNLREIAQKVKKINPELLVAVGGLHPTLFHRKILSDLEYIDFVIHGEAEESFLNLCLKLRNKDQKFDDIDGLTWRKNGEINVNQKNFFIDDLDMLPFPTYKDFSLDEYIYHLRYSKRKKNLGMSILTSRSCPNRCTFCSMFHSHGPRWRARSSENVLDEMELLYNEHQIRHFMFMDDNMTFNKQRTMAIFNGILKRDMKISFNFPNGISIKTLDREVIALMKETGCVEVSLPIESGSEHMRNDVMKKRLSDDKIFEVIELCNEYKLETIGLFILGMPGENCKTMEENISFVRQLKGRRSVDFISFAFATPFPGTVLFDQCVDEKLIDEKTIEELYEGTSQIFDTPIINLKTLSKEELIEYRNLLWKMFVKQNFLRLSTKMLTQGTMLLRIIKAVLRRFLYGNRTK